MKNRKIVFFLIILSLAPLINLFLTSDMPHTSDGTMHAVRFAAYYKEFIAGQFPVRWTSQFHYGYGTALFNFIAPLPYIMAIPAVAAGLPLTLILKLSFAATYIIAGVFMYMFSKKLFNSEGAAFLVAVMYQFAPFRLVEMNVRGNLGSLYAYALAPLLFYSILRMKEKTDYRSFALVSFSVGLLCLSHTILGYSFIGLAALFYMFFINDIIKLFRIAVASGAGIGLAAFFVFPAFLEQKYTNGYLFSKDVFRDHFPPIHKLLLPNFFDDTSLRMAEISVQIGFFHVLFFLTITVLLLLKRISKSKVKPVVFLLIATILTVLFIQPLAKPLWEHIPLIRQFQFPWRFLGLIIFLTSVSSGYAFLSLKFIQKHMLFSGLIFLIILATAYYWKPTQGYDRPDEKLYRNYPLTTNYFSEVNTIWMGAEPRGYPEKRIDAIGEGASIDNVLIKSTVHSFVTASPKNILVVDKTFFFPGWKAYIDGRAKDIQFQDPNYRGMITFEVPPGTHRISVRFEQSKIQQLSNLLSVSTLIFMVLVIPLKNLSIGKFYVDKK